MNYQEKDKRIDKYETLRNDVNNSIEALERLFDEKFFHLNTQKNHGEIEERNPAIKETMFISDYLHSIRTKIEQLNKTIIPILDDAIPESYYENREKLNTLSEN